MTKIIKMEVPPGLGRKEKLAAIFQKIVDAAKAKLTNNKEPQAVPEKYTFRAFVKAVLNDLISIVSVVVIGAIVLVSTIVVVLYTLIENSVRSIAESVRQGRKRHFKMKKV